MKSKNVKLYCKGGWEIDGFVLNETADRFIVKSNSTYIVYKDSISIIEIPQEEKPKPRKVKKDFSMPTQTNEFPENSLNYSEYQTSIPKSMLKNYHEKNNKEPDLSISVLIIGQVVLQSFD